LCDFADLADIISRGVNREKEKGKDVFPFFSFSLLTPRETSVS
jgi:hypothetical protein